MGAMFRSRSSHTIDAKGRIIVPARFKGVIQANGCNEVVITLKAPCLYAFTMKKWMEIEKKLLALKEDNMVTFKRIFLGNASICSCDKQDRILIPKALRAYAELEKEIELVGQLERFEIWSKKAWELENEKLLEELNQADVRKSIASLGL